MSLSERLQEGAEATGPRNPNATGPRAGRYMASRAPLLQAASVGRWATGDPVMGD